MYFDASVMVISLANRLGKTLFRSSNLLVASKEIDTNRLSTSESLSFLGLIDY